MSVASRVEPISGGEHPNPPIRQRRSRITYRKLIESGFELLAERPLDEIPVAEITENAGYSVGAFYARFKNKDEFHRALVLHFAAQRHGDTEILFSEASDEELLTRYISGAVQRIWGNRHFWRASIFRSIEDPAFWEPFRGIVRRIGDMLVERASKRIGRALTVDEEMNIRFAIQVVNGTINNVMMNRPGPVNIEDGDLVDRLERVFRLVSGWDELR